MPVRVSTTAREGGVRAATPPAARPPATVAGRLALFFVLTYGLTWWIVPLGSDSFPVFPYGPDAALLVCVLMTSGRAGLRTLGRTLRRWRANPGWYAFALLAPPAIGVASVLATRASGAPASAVPGAGSGLEFLLVLPVMVLVGGALGEELGWRGYALPVLQRSCAPVVAVGIVFVAHAVWHLPLFFAGDPPAPAPFLVELAGGGVVLAWLINSTRVIWLPILLHGAHNMAQQAFMSGFTGRDLVTLQWFTAVGWAGLAVVVLVATRGRLAARGRLPVTTALHEPAVAGRTEQAR